MAGKLGLVVDGSSWDPSNIIGSLYPQPLNATIGLLGADGVTMLAGNSPTKIGSPVLATGYQVLNAIGVGYDTGIADTITKTIMVLAKPVLSGTKRALGIGSYHGGGGTPPVPQGDTLLISPVDYSLRAIGSTSTGTVQSTIDGSNLDITKFHLYFGDFTGTSVQAHAFHNGALISAAAAAATGRAIPASNILVGAGNNIVAGNGVDAPIQESVFGVWTGVTLTAADKANIYATIKEMLGGIISIS
ncbi:hypothetical protein HUZ43_17550 [Raoultella ornithinolytica]|uniref:hypothetical protein n=1 Tax=Raoultella ornithinolytica TaxID=54291 RepID=UPI001EF96509|nr:hypothetical protein [Raoultella ornithinolytica]ULI45809.1 hypothetical protein HUZ43_17550 [Raoultella ornithinolytica]